jgi:hypothetical protein
VAWFLGNNDLRFAAYPFDWLLTLDHPSFILLLQEEFSNFMNENYLVRFPKGNIINTYYKVDFRHDWPDSDFEQNTPLIREKYQRRIKRFFELGHYLGRVYFFRGAFDISSDSTLPFITSHCYTVTPSEAEAIRDILHQKFPNLDFRLIILNYLEEITPDIQGLDRIIEFKIRKTNKSESYKQMLEILLQSGL